MSRTAEELKYRRRLIINASVLFVISCSLALVLLFLPSEDYFQYYLTRSDKDLGRQDYPALNESLFKATRYAKSREQWFSLFKRSYLAAVERNDFEDFQNLVQRSRKFIKGGADHEALNVAASLWTGQYEQASADLYTIQSERYKTLIAETLLSYDVYRNYDLGGMSALDFIKDKIRYQEDPVFFESVGRKAENPVLLYNAALLSMEAGDLDRAASIITDLPANRISPYHLALIFYDLDMDQRAYEAFKAQSLVDDMKGNQRFVIHQQIADLAMRFGNVDEALSEYSKALSIKPGSDWKTYRNMARIFLTTGYTRRAAAILKEGMDLFPGRTELLRDFVSFFHNDAPLEVRSALFEYNDANPADTEARLLRIRYFPGEQSSLQYQALIWDLFNHDVKNQEVARFLLWYLSGVGDIDGMEIVLERFDSGEENPYWYPFYRSVIATKRGDHEAALGFMRQVHSMNPSWFISYDLAVLEIARGNREQGANLLYEAGETLSLLNEVIMGDQYLSRIYYERALLSLESEDFKEASTLLKRALEADPGNIRAGSLLNRIQ